MKTKLLLPLILSLIFVSGCKSTPEAKLYKTTGTVIITVDAAMNAWGDYVRAGLATPEQQMMVKQKYDTYFQFMKTEEAAVMAYKLNLDTNGLAKASAAVTAATPGVINLILTFLPSDRVAKLKGLTQ